MTPEQLRRAAREMAAYEESRFDHAVAQKARMNRITGYVALGAGALIVALLIVKSQRKAK